MAWSLSQYVNIHTAFPDPVVVTVDVKGDKVTLKWKEPENNGGAITRYTIYKRVVNDAQWTRVAVINDISKHEYVVSVEKGKQYEFVVIAANKYGESLKNKDSIKTVTVEAGTLLKKEYINGPFPWCFPDF